MATKEHTICDHCGGLVFPDTKRCNQCKRFPVKLHLCPVCKTVAGKDEECCPKCARMFEPDGDYL
jgi:RNA polymerase subunit RPABC4/transcription elongation factor Spt4